MLVLVNGYNLRNKPVGIANVAINFINSFSKFNDYEIIVLLSTAVKSEVISRFENRPNVHLMIVPPKNAYLWFIYTLPKMVNKIKPDIFYSPTPLLPYFISKKIRRFITVHDFVSKEYRNTMTFAGRLISRFCEKKTINSASLLWCVSEYTKLKLQEYYSNIKVPIFVGSAPDPFFSKIRISSQERVQFFSKNDIEKPFLLFVGSLEPRKNLSFLLKVFKQFYEKHDYQLVIVGARSWGNTNIADILNEPNYPKEQVKFMNFLSEEDLRLLYNTATCYISTSLNEGFGLPQAEAMKCGCPVVSSHNSAMIEIVYGAGVTVKTWNLQDWLFAIENAINNREKIIEQQFQRIDNYSWPKISDEIHDVLNKNWS